MFTPAEVFRWVVTRSLEGLSPVEQRDVIAVLVACEAEGLGGFEISERLKPALLHARYVWPGLDAARRLYRDAAKPPVWMPTFDPRGGEKARGEEILLFAESAIGMWYGIRHLKSLLDSREQIEDLQVEIEGGKDAGCPVCQPHRGTRFSATLLPTVPIPPFHVGCGCMILPYRAEWEADIRAARLENKRVL